MKGHGKLVGCRGISCRDAIYSVSTKSDWERWLTVAQNLDVRHCLIRFEEWRSSSRASLTPLVYPHLCDRPQRTISSDIRGDRLIARRGRKSPANSRGGICNYSQTQTAGISFCHRAAITRNASCPKTANCRSPIPINSDIAPFSTRLLWTGRMPIPQENLLFVE